MRKNLFAIALTAMLLATTTAGAQDNNIKLPQPAREGRVTLIEALQNRHSARNFADTPISDETLSTILWAASGVNRPDGKLTVPSASNRQDIRVYVIRRDGAYLYLPAANSLQKVTDKDLRAAVASRQTAVATAPVALVLVSDHNKFGGNSDRSSRVGAIDAGYVSQNICLICSALGLNTVPRMTMDSETLGKELGLDDSYDFLINNFIGYPAAK